MTWRCCNLTNLLRSEHVQSGGMLWGGMYGRCVRDGCIRWFLNYLDQIGRQAELLEGADSFEGRWDRRQEIVAQINVLKRRRFCGTQIRWIIHHLPSVIHRQVFRHSLCLLASAPVHSNWEARNLNRPLIRTSTSPIFIEIASE